MTSDQSPNVPSQALPVAATAEAEGARAGSPPRGRLRSLLLRPESVTVALLIVAAVAAVDKRNVAMIAVMARAGLRVGEAVGLDIEDVTLRDRSGWVKKENGEERVFHIR